MVLDAVTVRNLELVEPLFAGERRESHARSRVLDQTCTGMGGRLLRQRLLRPSMDRAEIEARLDAVAQIAAADDPARGAAQDSSASSWIWSGCWRR